MVYPQGADAGGSTRQQGRSEPLRPFQFPLTEAIDCAKRIAGLLRQAVESTKRLLNLQLDRALLAALDFATTAEEQSFQTDYFRATIEKLTGAKAE